MTKGETIDRVVSAAIRHFPDRAAEIAHLRARSESFHDICDELAAAEEALARVDREPPELREARKEEWRYLIERLSREIDQALESANVVPLGPRKP
jgi:hypothetical protein